MLEKKDIGFLFAVLKMCDDIESYKIEYKNINNIFRKRSGINAVLMNLSQIGEYAGRISDRTRKRFKTIEWRKIKGLRNVIVHDYFGVDIERIKKIISDEIPVLIENLLNMLIELEKTNEIEKELIKVANKDMYVIKIT